MAFLNCLIPLGEGVFPMSFVPVQPLKRIAQAGVWTWEAGVKLSRSSSATGRKEGEDRWAAKNSGEVSVQQDLWLSLSHALVADTMQPHCSPFGPGDGSIGGCYRQS